MEDCWMVKMNTSDNSGYAVRFAHPNPYGLRIPASRYLKFRTPPLKTKDIYLDLT